MRNGKGRIIREGDRCEAEAENSKKERSSEWPAMDRISWGRMYKCRRWTLATPSWLTEWAHIRSDPFPSLMEWMSRRRSLWLSSKGLRRLVKLLWMWKPNEKKKKDKAVLVFFFYFCFGNKKKKKKISKIKNRVKKKL